MKNKKFNLINLLIGSIALFYFTGCSNLFSHYESSSVLSYQMVEHRTALLTWNDDSEAVEYVIFEKPYETHKGIEKARIKKGEDTKCLINLTYFDKPAYYFLRSINAKGKSFDSDIIEIIPNNHYFSYTIVEDYVEDFDTVKLTWYKLQNAESYNVYIGTENDTNTMTLFSGTEETEIYINELRPDIYYYFSVVPVSNQKELEFSEVCAVRLSNKSLPPSKFIVTDVSFSSITVEWEKSFNAPYYNLKLFEGNYENKKEVQTVVTEDTKYTFKDLKGNCEYSVVIKAFTRKQFAIDNESFFGSNQKTVTEKTLIPGISTPRNFTATKNSKPIKLAWESIPESTHYTLYYSVMDNFEWALKINCTNPNYSFDGGYGITYYFWVSSGTNTEEGEISQMITGYIPTEEELEQAKKVIDNLNQGGGNNYKTPDNSENRSYSYYISQYRYYMEKANNYYVKAYERLAKGDRAGYSTYMSMYRSQKQSADWYLEKALQA